MTHHEIEPHVQRVIELAGPLTSFDRQLIAESKNPTTDLGRDLAAIRRRTRTPRSSVARTKRPPTETA